ncbi:MAG TPA: hypothetical protein VHK69_00850 [Chitinophagaceae bacterium]|jgi:hypothetical protein|nr:hypothetical protein [Chitinophagaceae bacterium]
MASKIQLSPAEEELMRDAAVILTKNEVLRKVWLLLVEVQEGLHDRAEGRYGRQGVLAVPAKISRGENYRGLPYLVLDYPRYFSGDDMFAVRSFFWWGHFFSSTLHLAGRCAAAHRAALEEALPALGAAGYSLHTGNDPWQHHFGPDNYTPIGELSPEAGRQALAARPYIKIAAKWPLEAWPSAADVLTRSWERLMDPCGPNCCPGGETGP